MHNVLACHLEKNAKVVKGLKKKKVLMCECKRHTAHCVASACYAALCNGGGTLGTPHHPDLVGGYPISGLGEVPHPRSR